MSSCPRAAWGSTWDAEFRPFTIACAKRSPQGSMVGVDRWGKEYASYNLQLCEDNAQAEGVGNVVFQKGDATALPFEDETFDVVTSNYVYHNIGGADK